MDVALGRAHGVVYFHLVAAAASGITPLEQSPERYAGIA